jgi:hypothetical protein
MQLHLQHMLKSRVRDSHKRFQIEYNNRPIRDADSKHECFLLAHENAHKTFSNDSLVSVLCD